jgi:hypothetical protein
MGQFTSAFGNPMLQQMLQQIIQQGQPQQGMGMGGVQRPQMQQPQMLMNQPPASFAPSTMYGDGQFRPGEFNMQTMVDVQNAMGMGSPTAGIGMGQPQAMVNPMTPASVANVNQQLQQGVGMPQAAGMGGGMMGAMQQLQAAVAPPQFGQGRGGGLMNAMQALNPQAMVNPMAPQPDIHSLAPNPGNTSQPLGTFVNQTNPANRLLGAKPMKMKGML